MKNLSAKQTPEEYKGFKIHSSKDSAYFFLGFVPGLRARHRLSCDCTTYTSVDDAKNDIDHIVESLKADGLCVNSQNRIVKI